MTQQLNYAKLKNFDDFIRFIAMSPTPFIQHIEMKGKHVYFIHIIGAGGKMVYYIEQGNKIEEKYVVYQRFKDQITFRNTFESDGQSTDIPVFEIDQTNIFPEYPPK